MHPVPLALERSLFHAGPHAQTGSDPPKEGRSVLTGEDEDSGFQFSWVVFSPQRAVQSGLRTLPLTVNTASLVQEAPPALHQGLNQGVYRGG